MFYYAMDIATRQSNRVTCLRAETQLAMLRTSLRKVLPAPDDNPFAELLRALDRKVAGGAPSAERSSGRVLPLAVLAAFLMLGMSRLASHAVWQLSGGRYVDQVARLELHEMRTGPAAPN